MPVYRPYPQPQQRPRNIAPFIQGGAVALEALAAGRVSAMAGVNIAVSFASRAVGSVRTLAASSIARTLAANTSSGARIGAAANVARALTVNAIGRTRTLASAIVARALAVRSVGRTSVVNFFEGAGAVTARVTAGARVLGSLIASRALDARITGRANTRAGQRVAYALSAVVHSRTATRASSIAARALSATVHAGTRTLANVGANRALTAIVSTTASVRAILPPIFEAVVGFVRTLLRASMQAAGLSASMASSPIQATSKIRTPIVVSAIHMIATNVTIGPYIIGDDNEIAFELTEWPAGVTLAKAYFTIKNSLDDLDAAAVVQRDITSSLTAEGQITANGSLGTATGFFLIRHQDPEWANVRPGQPYQFDIQPITSQATVQTPIVGTITFSKGSTDAFS